MVSLKSFHPSHPHSHGEGSSPPPSSTAYNDSLSISMPPSLPPLAALCSPYWRWVTDLKTRIWSCKFCVKPCRGSSLHEQDGVPAHWTVCPLRSPSHHGSLHGPDASAPVTRDPILSTFTLSFPLRTSAPAVPSPKMPSSICHACHGKITNLQVQPLRHILWNVSWLPQAELMLPLLYSPITLSIALTQPKTTLHSVSYGPLCVRGHVLSIVRSPQHSVLSSTAATEC